MLTLTQNPSHVTTLPDVESERLKAAYPNLWSDPWTQCLTCQFQRKTDDPLSFPDEQKTFQWYEPGTRNVGEYLCNCSEQWVMYRWLLNRGIPKNYQRLGRGDTEQVPEPVKAAVKNYLDRADDYIDRGVNLILHSPHAGTGKTMMMMLAAKGLLFEGVDVFVAQMNSIVEMYTSGWRSKEEKDHFERRIMNCTVLGLDDLGKEQSTNTPEFINRLMDRVIRHRTANSFPTLVTSNFTKDQLQGGYGTYVMSLLSETAKFVEVHGTDFRQAARVRMDEEMDLGLKRPLVWW